MSVADHLALVPPFRTVRHEVVPMEEWEILHAARVGSERLVANLDRGNAPHYQNDRIESDWIAQPAAVLCEAAVAKHVGAYYDWSAWRSAQHDRHAAKPDIDGLEVRRLRNPNLLATVRRRDLDKDVEIAPAYVDMADPREVVVYGSILAEVAWSLGQAPKWDPVNARQFHVEHCVPHNPGAP